MHLLDADAVLTGHAAPELETGEQDLPTGRQRARRLGGIALVVQNDGMDVAVAGVEDVADAEPVARARRLDAREDLGEPRARDDAVLRAVARRQAADRAERAFPALPERRAFRLVGGAAYAGGTVAAAEVFDAGRARVEARGVAVDLDDQHGARVGREPEVECRFDRRHDRAVHHLERGRDDAGGDDRGHGGGRVGDGREDGEQGRDRLGQRYEAQRRRSHDPHRALGAADDARQVVTEPVVDRAAERDDLAVGQHQLDAEQMIGRDPVLERVRTAGILGDVAADRARILTGRIGRVLETRRSHHATHLGVHHPGLRDQATVLEVDRSNGPHAARADDERRRGREAAARESRTGAARDERDAGAPGRAHDARHLVGRARQDDQLRDGTLDRVAVAFIDRERRAGGDDGVGSDDRGELFRQRGRRRDRR